MNSKTLKIRKYKAGYEIREELHDGTTAYDGKNFVMKVAYTPAGDYIGNSRQAHRLVKLKGIKPEIIDSSHTVCSIGFCEKEQKWYGWSHRAVYGFGIGSKVKKGDCAYVPSNPAEIIKNLIEDQNLDATLITTCNKGKSIKVAIPMVRIKPVNPKDPEGSQIVDEDHSDCPPDHYIIDTGRGEWEAKTLTDARQMAVDFANNVS